jgi:hypothetical protein
MLKHPLWDSIWPNTWGYPRRGHFLCVGCVETRLGRRLNPSDFIPGNFLNIDSPHYSARLRDRMGFQSTRVKDAA